MSKPATGRQCGGGCEGSPALFWAAGAWSACRGGRQHRTLTCTDSQKGHVRHEVRLFFAVIYDIMHSSSRVEIFQRAVCAMRSATSWLFGFTHDRVSLQIER